MAEDYKYAIDRSDLLPVQGNTPWGYYDNDPQFQTDAQRAAFYIARRLGFGSVDVELVDFQIYAAYEEAVTTYGNEVYQYKIRENYLSLEGNPTDVFLGEYNITYHTASLIFSKAEMANWSDLGQDPFYSESVDRGQLFKVSASYISAMPEADISTVKTWVPYASEGPKSPITEYTYVSGGFVHWYYSDFCHIQDTTQSVAYLKHKGKYNLNNRIVDRTLGGIIKVANRFGDQAFVKNIPEYSASIDLVAGQQTYDLKEISAINNWIVQGDNIAVTRVFYEPLPAIGRYMNPFPGLGGVAAYPDAWGSYSGFSGNNYVMWPVFFDIQRIQEIEMAQRVRASNYSFAMNNNNLTVFPRPSSSGKMWLHYAKESELLSAYPSGSTTNTNPTLVINDVTKVPYSNPVYTQINSVGKSWIMRYALALSKEMLGYIRGKYPAANIPGMGAMSGADLITDARAEKIELLTQLRDLLDMTSREKQLLRQKNEIDSANNILGNIPLPQSIYIM